MEQVRHRIDSIRPRLIALRTADSLRADSILAARRRAAPPVELDSAMVGPFKVIGEREDVRRSRAAATAAWEAVAPLFKSMEGDAKGVELVAIFGATHAGPGVLAKRLEAGAHLVNLLEDRPDLWHAAYESAMGAVLKPRLAPAIRAWLQNGGIGPQNLVPTFRALVLTRPDTMYVSKSQQCTVANVAACRRVLGFDPPHDAIPNDLLRTSFISFVAHNGQPGSIARLSSDTATVIAAIEHLGGKPIDELIVQWRRYVSDNVPRGFQEFGRYAIVTIVWMAIFAGLAMRSTRWRLG
jgi:hypothetical protein